MPVAFAQSRAIARTRMLAADLAEQVAELFTPDLSADVTESLTPEEDPWEDDGIDWGYEKWLEKEREREEWDWFVRTYGMSPWDVRQQEEALWAEHEAA